MTGVLSDSPQPPLHVLRKRVPLKDLVSSRPSTSLHVCACSKDDSKKGKDKTRETNLTSLKLSVTFIQSTTGEEYSARPEVALPTSEGYTRFLSGGPQETGKKT